MFEMETCPICTDTLRSDHYSRHMATHIREIIKRDRSYCNEAIAHRSVCVAFRSIKQCEDGQQQIKIPFACCLGCGKHAGSPTTPYRYQYEKWCESCHIPYDERCGGCEKTSKRKQYTTPSRCEAFIQTHNAMCGYLWSSVEDWFDLRKPAPKLKIAARLTDRKQPRKTLAASKTEKPITTPIATPIAVPTITCDQIAKQFEDVFEAYFMIDPDDSDAEYNEDELEEYHEQRKLTIPEMLQKIRRSMDETKRQKQLAVSAKQNNKAAIDLAISKATQEVEAEVVKEHEKVLKLEQQLELAQSDARQTDKQLNQYRIENAKMMELLKANSIEYNPY